MKKINLFKMLAVLVVLITCINTTWAGTKRVYCKVTNATWLNAGAKVNVHYWGDGISGTTWPGAKMAASGTANVYYADIPDNATFKFCRTNPDQDTDWGHQTGNLSFPASPASGLNLYEITGSGSTSAGQWANIGFESTGGNDIKYYYSGNGSDQTWDISSASGGGATRDLGTITSLYLKGWDMKMYQNMDAAIVDGTTNRWLYYNIHRSAVSPGDYSYKTLDNWNWPDWSDGYRKPYGSKSCNDNLLTGLGSGIYSMTFYLQHNGLINFYLNNGGSNYNLKWTIGVPAMATHVVTSDGTGSGTDGSPFNMAVGSTLTITVSGTQASSDANSVLYVSFDNGSSYSATTTKSISIENTTKSYVQIKAKYYNSDDDLSGTVYDFGKVYYQGTITPSISLSAPTTAVRGNSIDLTATPLNASTPTIVYEYSTSSTFASAVTSIASTTSTTQSWTVPSGISSTTYYLRAKMTVSETTYYSSILTLTAYGKKTIKVKDPNGWSTMKLHCYDNSSSREAWPGSTTGVTSAGGQWYTVVLTSQWPYFILNDGTNQIKGDKTYSYASSVSDGSSYTISTGSGTSLTLTSTTAPTAPTGVTTTATPTSSTNAKMTVAGSIGTNGNDNITDYGFYYGTTDACGTKAQAGTSNRTGAISKEITGLTAGTTYYFKAYATNGQGTTHGTVQSYKLPYKVTVSTNTGCSSITNSGTKYTNSTIEVTATKATGYTFSSWSTTNGTQTSTSSEGNTNTLVFTPTSDNATIQPVYTQNMTTITITANNKSAGSVTVAGAAFAWDGTTTAGVATTRALVVTPAAGYYFSGWTRSDGADFHLNGYGESNTSVTLTGDGAGASSGQVLTANFTELDKIYFRNIFTDGSTTTRWSNVYAFLDYTWDGTKVHTNSNSSYKLTMTRIGITDVYWAYVPRAFTISNSKKIAFADTDFATNYTFYNAKASGSKGSARGDYNRALNMFVPFHTRNKTNVNGVDYYDNGYWMKYDTKASQGAGYYLKRYNSRNDYTQEGEFIATNDDATFIQFKLRIDAANSTRGYMITSAGGLNYVADAAITAANCTNVVVSENTETLSDHDVKFSLTTTSEGEYTFILNQTGDKMKLDVIYPVTAGDYILENAYTDGGAKTTHSNIIKAADAATKTRYSMFLSNAGSGTLKLKKCESVNAKGVPTWSAGDATNLSGILSDGKFTPGVYQFDITIADDKVATIDSVRLYTGDFYIKTDAAPGGWVTYKRNIMDKNTLNFDRTSATFDNYWCHHYDSKDVNIKCVIANDYCNQLSDTLKEDGISQMAGGEPYVPVDGTSIRFSYNSATNTISRAYLGASSADNFLNIEANETPANSVYKSDGTTNVCGATESQRKFDDLGNWVYDMNLKVKPGGCAGVKAVYTDASSVAHTQTLIPTTNVLLGGSGSTKYDIRVVYDFKTNYLMTAFNLPDGKITDALENVDMLWIRHKDESPTQLQLGTGGSLSNVSVVAAIELRYNELYRGYAGDGHVDLTNWTPTNRPYLKYFISFPFDVPVNSVFGLNQAELGREYVIQKYNGAKRAKEGLFGGDGDNYWENLTKDSIMHANEGYCVIFDNEYVSGSLGHIWDNKESGSSVYLYFPAKDKIASITNSDTIVKVDSLVCRINRAWANDANKNHQKTDSHWHMIGSPLFHDSYIKSRENLDTFQLRSYYKLDYTDNKWKAQAITEGTTLFKAMSSVMVQWYGNVTWTTTAGPYAVPVRTSAPMKNYLVQLDLSYNGNTPDWAYVQLQDGADDDFILREDMYKMYNSGIPQIYTFAGAYDVAYNGVPIKSQTIPVGVLIRKNGTYTFSMPTTFSGTVTLIDTFEQTRTDLSLTDYTVELEKGTINDRFLLEINIENVVTSLENENGNNVLNDGGAHKFIKNDNMYILRNGIIYDAQGRKVK